MKKQIIRIAAALILFIPAILMRSDPDLYIFSLVLFIASYMIAGFDVLAGAVRSAAGGDIFGENLLMSIATVGAFLIGEFPEGVAVMLFFRVGEMFEDLAVSRSRRSISALMDIRPDKANLLLSGEISEVPAEDVSPGDVIVIRPGEKVPLDAVVIRGASSVDTSALTGESIPRDVSSGSEVLSGFINMTGVIEARVTKPFGETTASRILDLVENSASKKSKAESFITRFSRYYTPSVVAAAILIAFVPPVLFGFSGFSVWAYRALSFLVVSCPCALVISVPLAFFGGIGAGARLGILFKGGVYIESLSHTETAVFDKTGTLTSGEFSVRDILPQGGIDKDELLRLVALCESCSSHPISLSIRAHAGSISGSVSDIEEIPGFGVCATIDGVRVFAGNLKLMQRLSVHVPERSFPGTVVHACADGRYLGCIVVTDNIKPGARAALEDLRSLGVKRTVMLTGDVASSARDVSQDIGISEVFSSLLPDEKTEMLDTLLASPGRKGSLVYIGDGINDAPSLAISDVGVAIGAVSSAAAIEASDVVIMSDDISKVPSALRLSKRTVRIARENIVFALFVKISILILCAFGFASMWAAVFADVGVAVIAILNSLRALDHKKY